MKKALCVGINKFLRPGNDLRGCVADANQMAEMFEALGCSVTLLTDAKATKANILGCLQDMIPQAKKDKWAYFGFSQSSHGTHYNSYTEADGLGEALVCYDAKAGESDWDMTTIFPDIELRPLLNQIPLTCITEVPLDTCFSGGMDRVIRWSHQEHAPENKFIHNPGNLDGRMRIANTGVGQGLNRNIVMWCACSEAQTSADAYLGGGAHGAFTYFWMDEYKRNQKASRVELLVKTRKALRANGFDQTPRLKCWNKESQMAIGT